MSKTKRAETVQTAKATKAPVFKEEVIIPPVQKGQTVYVSVLPKMDFAQNWSDCSPKLFATEEAAQADCDMLNKTRGGSKFVVRTMEIN